MPRMFIHQVCFWLKQGTPDAAREQLIADCRKYLGAVPTVRQLWAGPPHLSPRDVVDNSYQVGLLVLLDDSAGHDVYQEHPLHLEFIARNKAHWERARVLDFVG
jgi:hypothetical protein